MEFLGYYLNDKNYEVFKIDNKNIVLDGWNGEKYCDCFKVNDYLTETISKNIYVVKPIYTEISENQFDYENLEIIEIL